MQRSIVKGLTAVMLLAVSTFSSGAVHNNRTCGITPGQPINDGALGPYDYTDQATHSKWSIVANAHFNSDIEYLRSPNALNGIDYTLRSIPNHHRALYAMMQGKKRNLHADKGSVYTMECYFKRAIYFRPKDATVHMLNGMYYHWNSQLEKSEEKYLDALELRPNDPQTHYNLGLLYFEKGDYENASKHAEAAYKAGHPLEGLRKKLEGVNVSVTE